MAALGILLSTAHLTAHALALGPVTPLSALGEPLVAGISVPEISPEEFASLKVTLATPEAFAAAGMDYNAALASAQFTLHRRPDGTTYLLLRSDKMVTDPFVNLVVSATWAGGRVVRNYTLLIDPPAARQNEANTITAPLAATTPALKSAPLTQTPVIAPRPIAEVKPTLVQTAKQPATAVASKNSGDQIKVSAGSTAGKIAADNLPANVSLDQMLIALLRGNPDAFIGNNINRLKAGAVLSLPTNEEALATPANTARQTILAQSRDFNNFRRKLAESAPSIASKEPDRQAGGKIEAKVEDRKTASVAPDKLTLSKGGLSTDPKVAAVKDNKDNSDKIAKERQAKDDSARVAELSKNITDLNKIAESTPAIPVKPETKGTAPFAPTVAGAPAVSAAPAATTAASIAPVAPAMTPAAPVVAATPTVVPPVKPITKAKVPVPEPGFMDALTDNPAVLPAAGGLLALLALGGFYIARKRKNSAELDEEDEGDELDGQDDKLNADFADQTLFHNTTHAAVGSDEVQISPVRVDSNTAAVEPAYLPTARTGAETPVVQERVFIPELPASSAQAVASVAIPTLVTDDFPDFTPSEFSKRTVAQLDPESTKSPASVDLDLDFDFESDFSATKPASPAALTEIKPVTATTTDFHSLDFDISSMPAPAAGASATTATAPLPMAAELATTNQIAPLEFDMDSLSLDLNASIKEPTAGDIGPLETKLALAQEFRAIGDASGAKMLAQEVIDLATGSLKIKAETLLAEIG